MQSSFLSTALNQISIGWMTLRGSSVGVFEGTGAKRAPRLMCVLAHPDDEALCLGGTLARYSAQGTEVALVVATRGERGWRGPVDDDPGPTQMGQTREAELRNAARILGVERLRFLGYIDGELERVPLTGLVAKITGELRQFRPDVVITFDARGMYGHPDHVIVSQATSSAILCASDESYDSVRNLRPHRVKKLYHRVFTASALDVYQRVFGELVMQVGQERRTAAPWEEWAITTRIDSSVYADIVWNAIAAHRSQLVPDTATRARFHKAFSTVLGFETFYRAVTLVDATVRLETDLLEGLESQVRADAAVAPVP